MSQSAFHPVAEIFPLMSGAQLEELAADIVENRLREPIWRFKGQIIDGRNRYMACMKYAVEPTYREYEGAGNGDLIKFVVSVNLHRRHLNESQRAMIAAKIATRSPRANCAADKAAEPGSNLPQALPPSTKQAASMLNVSRSAVKQARRVVKNAIPEIAAAVDAGEMRLHAAAEIAKEPKQKQAEAMGARKNGMHREPSHKISATKTRSLPKTNAARAIRNAIGTLIGLASSLVQLDAKDANFTAEEAKQFDGELTEVVATIRRFRRQLMEVVNGN